jgi:ABC-type branched-subunit amino acid transport system permease subunit
MSHVITAYQSLGYIQKMPDNERRVHELSDAPTPSGFAAIGAFLFFGATMATLAAISLIWSDTSLDRMWSLNPTAYRQLSPLGRTVGMLFVLLGAALAAAGIGWFRRRLWGWRLAVVIIATQVVGDVINCIRGDWLRGGIGVVIAGALLLFLLRPRVKNAFA